ncbi:hypothetical protein OKJ48_21025 [Streptomyces kunmingensis]|uniref:Secreted protein n=1 Tax=Streptomyces kunmingensis TaxID=68225 RepID=A0ABU6CDB8_9ACTN|nr:hypothetical protein [Streptomyces kunmingensis]MEB3962711.1 hypothetical protein [Streptomyces kunmingensis]
MNRRLFGKRRTILALPLVGALGAVLVVGTATDASAKRYKQDMSQSFAMFSDSYQPQNFLDCKYVDKKQNKLVDDYRCSDGSGTSRLLADILTQDSDKNRMLPPDGSGWKYLAAPDHFKCLWNKNNQGIRTAETFKCKYDSHHFPLDWMVFATQDVPQGVPPQDTVWYVPNGKCWIPNGKCW